MKLIIYSFLLVFLITSCKKERKSEPKKLPEYTQVGANTFGCLIENEVYVPELRRLVFMTPSPLKIDYPSYPYYSLSIRTNRTVSKSDSDSFEDAKVDINIFSVKSIGEYNVSGNVNYNGRSYRIDTIKPNSVIITYLDTIKGIVSGKFSFKAKNEYNSSTILITEGRFDVIKK